jgi:hypothetical protein
MEEITQVQSKQVSGGFTIVMLRNLPERVFIDTTTPQYLGYSPASASNLRTIAGNTKLHAFA